MHQHVPGGSAQRLGTDRSIGQMGSKQNEGAKDMAGGRVHDVDCRTEVYHQHHLSSSPNRLIRSLNATNRGSTFRKGSETFWRQSPRVVFGHASPRTRATSGSGPLCAAMSPAAPSVPSEASFHSRTPAPDGRSLRHITESAPQEGTSTSVADGTSSLSKSVSLPSLRKNLAQRHRCSGNPREAPSCANGYAATMERHEDCDLERTCLAVVPLSTKCFIKDKNKNKANTIATLQFATPQLLLAPQRVYVEGDSGDNCCEPATAGCRARSRIEDGWACSVCQHACMT